MIQRVISAVKNFNSGLAQSGDMTALILFYSYI
jgi:hypothetical protein